MVPFVAGASVVGKQPSENQPIHDSSKNAVFL